MKRFALLPTLSALLLAAVLTGAAFAQQAPPGPTSPQAGDMIPDANTIAAFAARSTATGNTPQAGDMIPDASTIADFAARSATLESASKSGAQWQIAQRQAYGLAQGSQTAQLAPSHDDEKAAVMRDMVQAMAAIRSAQTAQLAPSHDDDSIEAPQVAAAMRAMAAAHMPSMEVIRLALASARAAAEAKAQSAQITQLVSSRYDSLGALTSAQARALGLPALAGIKEMAEERYLTAILQNPTLLALVLAEEASQSQHVGLTVGELARLASAESQHEATESPVEAAFEAAEAAHNPGFSMLQVFP